MIIMRNGLQRRWLRGRCELSWMKLVGSEQWAVRNLHLAIGNLGKLRIQNKDQGLGTNKKVLLSLFKRTFFGKMFFFGYASTTG